VEEIEGIQERLDNIKAIRPILSALRTIAGATWRAALKRRRAVNEYARQLEGVLAAVEAHLPSPGPPEAAAPERSGGEALLVISAERGLCGGFNRVILEAADDFIARQQAEAPQLQLLTLGDRARRHFLHQKMPILRSEHLPVTSLLPFARAQALAYWLLEAYVNGEIAGLQVMYNRYLSAMAYSPTVRRLLPPPSSRKRDVEVPWPPPILETGPVALRDLAMKQLIAAQLYSAVVESAASEQAARLQAMERSTQNAERLIEELSLSYHQARQQAITQEMLDLAAGAGMLAGSREEDNQDG